jgi:hypothetical protein
MRALVATARPGHIRPNPSAAAELSGLGRQRGEHVLVGDVEAGDAPVLQVSPTSSMSTPAAANRRITAAA